MLTLLFFPELYVPKKLRKRMAFNFDSCYELIRRRGQTMENTLPAFFWLSIVPSPFYIDWLHAVHPVERADGLRPSAERSPRPSPVAHLLHPPFSLRVWIRCSGSLAPSGSLSTASSRSQETGQPSDIQCSPCNIRLLSIGLIPYQ